jgi:3-deoxy-D-manno-octulosonate 8-phosphate phosphatase (KDO 8-P phosphatase)
MLKGVKLQAAARRIKLLILDVDGVLTDGRMMLSSNGDQTKVFDVRDGFGIVLAHQAGLKTAIITAERSGVVSHRAQRLGIGWVEQAALEKGKALGRCLKHFRLKPEEAAYIGDDLLDLPVLTRVGLGVAVADADPEVKRHVHHVTKARGGWGAVRETIELLLKAQGHWAAVLRRYLKDA